MSESVVETGKPGESARARWPAEKPDGQLSILHALLMSYRVPLSYSFEFSEPFLEASYSNLCLHGSGWYGRWARLGWCWVCWFANEIHFKNFQQHTKLKVPEKFANKDTVDALSCADQLPLGISSHFKHSK